MDFTDDVNPMTRQHSIGIRPENLIDLRVVLTRPITAIVHVKSISRAKKLIVCQSRQQKRLCSYPT